MRGTVLAERNRLSLITSPTSTQNPLGGTKPSHPHSTAAGADTADPLPADQGAATQQPTTSSRPGQPRRRPLPVTPYLENIGRAHLSATPLLGVL